jgi:hypothetical protein
MIRDWGRGLHVPQFLRNVTRTLYNTTGQHAIPPTSSSLNFMKSKKFEIHGEEYF